MPATNELLQEESVSALHSTSAPADGDTLEELLRRNNRAFPATDVLAWAEQLLEELGSLHKASPPVIHQNVRPENIVLSPNGKVKLGGVGLNVARSIGDSHLRYSPLEQIWDGLDAASQKVITNSYDERSERVLKSPLDARSDLYSVAATLYYLLTATPPVDPLERSIEMLDGNGDPLRDPSALNSNVPVEVSQVLLKALEIKRENRFDSAAIMRQVLRSSFAKSQDTEDVEFQIQTQEAAKSDALKAEDQQKAAKELEHDRSDIEEQLIEEQARLEEHRAAEPELQLQDEYVGHDSVEPSAADEELLELDISVMPNVEAHISSPPVIGADDDAIELSVIDAVPTPRKSVSVPTRSDSGPEKDFSYQETSSGSSMFSVPVMAAAAAVLIVVFVGIYFVAFSGSSAQPAPAATVVTNPQPTEAPVSQPQAPAANPESAASTSSDTSQQPTTDTAVKQEAATPTKAAAKPTPGKDTKTAATAKEPAKVKKPVTADDLINDN